jgi:hypothetical protein
VHWKFRLDITLSEKPGSIICPCHFFDFQSHQNIHQMLAAIILHREQKSTRAELLYKTSRIRREAKDQIDSGKMTLDGLTVGQINSVFNNTPKLRQSFQKILNSLSG